MTALTIPQVILKPRKALPFFSKHPWVFAGAISKVVGDPEPGAEVDLLTHKGEFVARGLFNPNSNIRVRLYTWDATVSIDEELWSKKIDRALELRQTLTGTKQHLSAVRLVYSEADGLSGLIVDRYGDFLLLQFTSLALSLRQECLVKLLIEKLQPKGIWLRTEKGIREAEGLEIDDGLLFGEQPPKPLFVEENGIQFGLDLVEGQKTGFYCDQRENRLAAARYMSGHRVLDLFCYTGGFALAAVVLGGAREVIGIDSSDSAIRFATSNAELNSVTNSVQFEKSKVLDALARLSEQSEEFDSVILDPPKMARHRSGLRQAMRGYQRLNEQAISILKPGGILVTCSCSGHVTREHFEEMLAQTALNAGREIQILEARGQAADHPVSIHCLENNYLKCYICRVL